MDIQGLIEQYHQISMNEGFEGDESDKRDLVKSLIALDICNSLARIDESLESISKHIIKQEEDYKNDEINFS
jgi:hypothetical protein